MVDHYPKCCNNHELWDLNSYLMISRLSLRSEQELACKVEKQTYNHLMLIFAVFFIFADSADIKICNFSWLKQRAQIMICKK